MPPTGSPVQEGETVSCSNTRLDYQLSFQPEVRRKGEIFSVIMRYLFDCRRFVFLHYSFIVRIFHFFPLFVFQHHLWAHSVHQQEPLGFCCPWGRLLSDQRGEQCLLSASSPYLMIFFCLLALRMGWLSRWMRKAHATTTAPVPKSTTKEYCTVMLAVVSHVWQLTCRHITGLLLPLLLFCFVWHDIMGSA